MLHAVAELRKTPPARLLIIDDGDERGELESLAARLGLEQDVRFVGWQSI